MSLRRHSNGFESALALRELPPGLDEKSIREQCARILVDPIFAHSKRSSELLTYIVDRTLAGNHECLKERIIGIEQFGRSPDYNTGTDATVRSAVFEVRKRLNRYFEGPEHRDEVRIDLPSGSYIAVFHLPEVIVSGPHLLPDEAVSVVQSAERERTVRTGLRSRWLYAAIASLCILVPGYWGVRRLIPPSPIDRFWAPLLHASAPGLILIGTPVTPEDPPGDGGVDMHLRQLIERQPNFPIAEINAANMLNGFLGRHGKQAAIRLAQSTSLSDLRLGPAVVLGSSEVNQWQQSLGAGMHFQFKDDLATQTRWIEDADEPGNQKWEIKFNLPLRQNKSEYALITRTHDASTGQWWIGMGGETVLGTIAAQRMMMDPPGSLALVSQLPKGWENRNVQIVVGFDLVDGSLGASHVLKTYTW